MNSQYFDHTVLKATATKEDVIRICEEALEYGFASVCVNSYWVKLVAEKLANSDVKTCTVVGFPLGAMSTAAKAAEAGIAVEDGADEVDMVINIGELKAKAYDNVLADIKEVKKACKTAALKVIIETCYLTDEEKVKSCELAVEAGADFVKTSTGFGTAGAVVSDVKLMKKTVGDKALVKASGSIRNEHTAKMMIDAGADRLGTSATVDIMKGE